MEDRRRGSEDWAGAAPEDYRAAVTDGASGLFVRAYLADILAREFRFAARHGTPVSLALFRAPGLDGLRREWGDRGHGAAVAALARRLRAAVRAEDVLAAWDRDTFALLLRDVGGEAARLVAERLRRAASASPLSFEGLAFQPVLAAGVAARIPARDEAPLSLVEEAEGHLRRALQEGGDRVVPPL